MFQDFQIFKNLFLSSLKIINPTKKQCGLTVESTQGSGSRLHFACGLYNT